MEYLVTELRGRGLVEESHKSKQLMEYALTLKLCGVRMVPGLLYGDEFKEIRNVLRDYEILLVEPCHSRPYQKCVYRITTSFTSEWKGNIRACYQHIIC